MPLTLVECGQYLLFLLRQYEGVRFLSMERWAAVELLAFGEGQIIMGDVGDRGGYDAGYNYDTFAAAVAALSSWSGVDGTEPDGWVRAYGGGRPMRRRPDGDASREYLDDGR